MLNRALASYSLHGLAPMQDVPNVSSLIEQIDMASTMATFFMRSHGVLLAPDCQDVPLQDEVDRYLRKLVLEAYYAFNETKAEALAENPNIPDWEIEGYAGDDRIFEVSISGVAQAPRGFMHLQILYRLT